MCNLSLFAGIITCVVYTSVSCGSSHKSIPFNLQEKLRLQQKVKTSDDDFISFVQEVVMSV